MADPVDLSLASLNVRLDCLNRDVKAFRRLFNDRFDQQTELIKSRFRALSFEIQTLKKN